MGGSKHGFAFFLFVNFDFLKNLGFSNENTDYYWVENTKTYNEKL